MSTFFCDVFTLLEINCKKKERKKEKDIKKLIKDPITKRKKNPKQKVGERQKKGGKQIVPPGQMVCSAMAREHDCKSIAAENSQLVYTAAATLSCGAHFSELCTANRGNSS